MFLSAREASRDGTPKHPGKNGVPAGWGGDGMAGSYRETKVKHSMWEEGR